MSALRQLLARHCRADSTATKIPHLTLMRAQATTPLVPAIAFPQFCVIAAGRKRVFLGAEPFVYDPSTYLVTSAQLPVAGQVIVAPYFGLSLAIDVGLVADVLLSLPPMNWEQRSSKALTVTRLDPDLQDAVLRLVRLLDEPQHIAALAPLAEREIIYRLLLGPHGAMLRQMAAPASPLSQIRRAIDWLHQHFGQPMEVAQLARLAGMSPPTFHRHFRAITNMSPLQFHKRIRLQEARRRLLTDHSGAAAVAFDVGYESPSQFSREYRRMFGAPPTEDVARARRRLGAPTARPRPAAA